jgi:hypothetical protein
MDLQGSVRRRIPQAKDFQNAELSGDVLVLWRYDVGQRSTRLELDDLASGWSRTLEIAGSVGAPRVSLEGDRLAFAFGPPGDDPALHVQVWALDR